MNRIDCVNTEVFKAVGNFRLVVSPLLFLCVFTGAVGGKQPGPGDGGSAPGAAEGREVWNRHRELMHVITTLARRPRGSDWKESREHLYST